MKHSDFSVPLAHPSSLPLPVATVGLLALALFCQGCGANTNSIPAASLMPATSTAVAGEQVKLAGPETAGVGPCEWASSNPDVAAPSEDGVVTTRAPGHAVISMACEGDAPVAGAKPGAEANVVVASQAAAGPIIITKGGTYSGTWTSTDPGTAAVNIKTDEPVILQDSVVSGRGNLITINGRTGATVTIKNVTGTGLDPQVAGKQRGAFLVAGVTKSLLVENCTIIGTSYGIKVVSSTLTSLTILNNKGSALEDRASNGAGGLLTTRPSLGHFILVHQSTAAAGAEIGWNQLVQTIGQSSTEDPINIYKSSGGPGHPIYVHDNYLEGFSSTTTPSYTGNGITVDGDSTSMVPAYVLIKANDVVHTAGGAVMIAAGHDVVAQANRVVSCGQDSTGAWFSRPALNAMAIWNYYAGPSFYNNSVTTTAGGLVSPSTAGKPVETNMWISPNASVIPSNTMAGNLFTNPCMVGGVVNVAAENAERAYWTTKVTTNKELIGDQHTL